MNAKPRPAAGAGILKFDLSGTPHENAATSVLMFAIMSTDQVDPEDRIVDQAGAQAVLASVLREAAAGGFKCNPEFITLVVGGQLTERLEHLALDIVNFAGGVDKVTDMLAVAMMRPEDMGRPQ